MHKMTRLKALCAVIIVITVLLCYVIIIKTGVVKGANQEVDQRIEGFKKAEEIKHTKEGQFIDRSGEAITLSGEPGKAAELLFPESYSPLIGYNSQIYGTSNLRNKYKEQLLLGGKDGIGATIKLTTDNNLQQLSYELLGENQGSVAVIRPKTGEILAMTSRSSASQEYNVNEIDNQYETYAKNHEFFYNRAILSQDPPGSTFKMITATSMIENKLAGYTYEDVEEGYLKIKNSGGAVFGNLKLSEALTHSVNTYFASAGNLLGGTRLCTTAREFMLGETIDTDFGTLQSTLDLGHFQKELVAQTAFGQGRLQVSPLQIATWLGTLTNDGVMMKPYVIRQITDGKKVTYREKPEVLSDTIESGTCDKMKKMLHQTALHYGFDEETYGKIYAKTGTAQVKGKSGNHIYLVFGNDEYCGILSMDEQVRGSKSLVPAAKEILAYVNSLKE